MPYNGWATYETWLVNLWMTNAECTERGFVRACAESPDAAKAFVEGWLECEEAPTNGLAADLLGAALSEVDWAELHQHFKDEDAE